jgi:hypothetical protein
MASSQTFDALGVFAVQKIDEFHTTQCAFDNRLAIAEGRLIDVQLKTSYFAALMQGTPAETVRAMTEALARNTLLVEVLNGYVDNELSDDIADLRSDVLYNQQMVDKHTGDIKKIEALKKYHYRILKKDISTLKVTLVSEQQKTKALEDRVNILDYENRFTKEQLELMKNHALEVQAQMEARLLEHDQAASNNMNLMMERLRKLEEKATATASSSSSSSFGDVMGIVQAQQIMKLRDETAELKQMIVAADSDSTVLGNILTKAHASMVALQHRADEAAWLVNEIEDIAHHLRSH